MAQSGDGTDRPACRVLPSDRPSSHLASPGHAGAGQRGHRAGRPWGPAGPRPGAGPPRPGTRPRGLGRPAVSGPAQRVRPARRLVPGNLLSARSGYYPGRGRVRGPLGQTVPLAFRSAGGHARSGYSRAHQVRALFRRPGLRADNPAIRVLLAPCDRLPVGCHVQGRSTAASLCS